MTRLVELCPGKWVNPQEVTAVLSMIDPTNSAKRHVWVYLNGRSEWGWDLPNEAEANAWAAEIAERVNGVLPTPACPRSDEAAEEPQP
jgi:hypothetical protein